MFRRLMLIPCFFAELADLGVAVGVLLTCCLLGVRDAVLFSRALLALLCGVEEIGLADDKAGRSAPVVLFLRFLEARSAASRCASSSSLLGRWRFLLVSPCKTPWSVLEDDAGAVFSLSGCELAASGVGKLPGKLAAWLSDCLTCRTLDWPTELPNPVSGALPNSMVWSLRKVNELGAEGTLFLALSPFDSMISLNADKSG